MTRDEAYEIDKGHGAYSDRDPDPESAGFVVLGAKSGFCYGGYNDIADASDAGVALHEELMFGTTHEPSQQLTLREPAPGAISSLTYASVENPTPKMREAIQRCIGACYFDDPIYHLRTKAQPFLQCCTDDYMLVEFWSHDKGAQQAFIDKINALAV